VGRPATACARRRHDPARAVEPSTPADLTKCRLELAVALHDGARPPRGDEQGVSNLLLAFEELVSNALRHGRPPVTVEVTTSDDCWLLDVSDAAVDRPPTPAVGRDAANGGLGLFLVAHLSRAHGWTIAAGRKHVWARIDHADGESPGRVPQRRDGTGG
jgi:anti-sigma regulatory factor (Ser/Thr protein kinase)